LLGPGLGLIDGRTHLARRVAQEITHHVVHTKDGSVLWCDGDHGFNPYNFAELNLVRGHSADDGAGRVLVKRCMTPFQWDTVLTKHLSAKLETTKTSLVLALPYDRLFSTDELKDWEQEDYVKYSLGHLRGLATKHRVPILIGVDMARLRLTHPALATLVDEGVERRWTLGKRSAGENVVPIPGDAGESGSSRQVNLLDSKY
jgi:hypothetical protein